MQDFIPAIAQSILKKGEKVWVVLPSGQSIQVIAANDSVDRKVIVADGYAIGNASQIITERTTDFFQSKLTYGEDGVFPYVSVFIDQNLRLVSTYNGSQVVIGQLEFPEFVAVNLNNAGNGLLTGTLLSDDKTKVVLFNQTEILEVVDLPLSTIVHSNSPSDRRILSGNVVYDLYDFNNNFQFKLSDQDYPVIQNDITDNLDYAWVGDNIGNPTPAGLNFDLNPNNYAYTDARNVVGYSNIDAAVNPGGYSNATIEWNYSFGDTIAIADIFNSVGIPQGDHPFSGTLSNSFRNFVSRDYDGKAFFPVDSSDNELREAKIIRVGTGSRLVTASSNYAVTGLVTKSGNSASMNLTATGGTDSSTVVNEDFFHERLNPTVVNDYKTVNDRDYTKRVLSSTLTTNTTATGTSVFNDVDTSSTSQFDSDFSNVSERVIIFFVFNVGELGIWLELTSSSSQSFIQQSTTTREGSNVALATVPNTPPASISWKRNYNFLTVNTNSGSSNANSSLSDITDTESKRVYKIAYKDEPEIEAVAGYAGLCTVTPVQKLFDFFSGNLGDPNIVVTLSTPYTRTTERRIKRTRTSTTVNNVSNISLNTDYAPSNALSTQNFDFTNQLVVVKQRYADVNYLALCRVGQVNFTNIPDIDNSSSRGEIRVTSLDCEILSVKTINTFLDSRDFIFSVDGCAIFNFLEAYKTNVILVENGTPNPDVYLASTISDRISEGVAASVTENDTEVMIFKLNSNGLTFHAIADGDISDPTEERSPGSADWANYWERPPTSYF